MKLFTAESLLFAKHFTREVGSSSHKLVVLTIENSTVKLRVHLSCIIQSGPKSNSLVN